MDKINVFFENANHEYDKDVTYYDISKDSSLIDIVAVKINNEVFSLDKKALDNEKIEFINYLDTDGNKIYKSGLKFIFEVALSEVFPSLEVSYEHSVPRGMLAIISGDKILNNEDISKIKERMTSIIMDDLKFEKLNVKPKEAIKYYKNNKEYEKAYNIQNINDKAVTFYKLKNKLNYFYTSMPYNTKSIKKYDLVYLGMNKIIILFPSKRSNGVVPEYVHYDNILESFYNGKKWLEKLNIPYVTNLNKLVSDGSIKEFIRASELVFNKDLSRVVDALKKNRDKRFILIAGPSSSGKTTTTKVLSSFLYASGFDPISISLDNYFVDRSRTPRNEFGELDYECLRAIDVEKFNEDLTKLLNYEEVKLPIYNFLTGKSELSKDIIKAKENSIFLIEGLHALNDDLTPALDERYKYKIYLSPFIPLNVDRHNYISTIDLRLIRRIVRDNRTRGYKVTDTIDTWQSVRSGEEKYIFPYIHQADCIVNTALAYEIGVLKVYVEPLLYSVGVDSKCYAEARRLLDFLKQFFPIPGEYVSDESILREFIGGGKYSD